MLTAILFLAPDLLAQSALDSFDPGANLQVFAVALQADGKVVVGGEFNLLGGGGTGQFTRNRIGRLNGDGTIDPDFDPGADFSVHALAVRGDGSIVVGGDFTMLGGGGSGMNPRPFLGLLDSNGNVDPVFNPQPNNPVLAIALQPNGKVLVAGGFTMIGSVTRNHIARLESNGDLDTTFQDPAVDGAIHAVAVQSDGKIIIGGEFNFLGAIPRAKIARLNPDGTLDMAFDPSADDTVLTLVIQPDGKILVGGQFSTLGNGGNFITRLNADGTTDTSFQGAAGFFVNSILLQTDGKIIAAGQYGTLDGQPRKSIGRLNFDGTLDMTFNPGAGPGSLGVVLGLALQPDDKVVVVGRFNTLGNDGTTPRENLGRVYPSGALDDTFDPGADASVKALALQTDGKIVVGGGFSNLGGGGTGTIPRSRIGRLNPDGTPDSFDPGADDNLRALVVQPDGKIVVGGNFNMLGGGGTGTNPRSRIGRLNADGTLDDLFDPGANNDVAALALQADGKILVGGIFSKLGGGGTGVNLRDRIGRLTSAGDIDDSFDPGANAIINVLAVQPADDKILVGGAFTMLGGGGSGQNTRNFIGRLNPAGDIDDSFDPGANNNLFALRVQADGSILAGGFFTTFGGGGTGMTTRNRIARVSSNNVLDQNFDPGADAGVLALATQTDGKILVGGNFTMLGGGGTGMTTRNFIGRLASDGTLDDSFDPGADGSVSALTLQADGKVLVSGSFSTVGGGGTGTTPRSMIARLTNTDPAFQELTVDSTGTTITWLRSGSSPEVDRVTFALSADGITYDPPLGATRISGGWELSGQSLPVLQNMFIRARGFYSTGKPDGAGSIVENVRNVFITPAPVIDSPLTATAIVGEPFTYQISATNSPTTFDAINLAPGLTRDTGTGLITGTPSSAGTFFVTISATNAGGSDSDILTLTVNAQQASPTITTQASGSIPVGGGTISDTATLANGATPTGTITFMLFGPDNATCSGAAIFTSTKSASGNGSYISDPFTPSAAGTYRWVASYSGDVNNDPVSTVCNDANESVIVTKASPTINTQASPTSVSLGGNVSDTATLSNGATPTGTITFQLFGPDDATCSNAPIFTSAPQTVSGNGDYSSGLFQPPLAGTYRWTASYSGDANNNAAATICNDANESVTVTPAPAAPVITSPLSATATQSQLFVYQILATGSPTSYGAMNLPNGLTIDTTLGVISGTPTQAGSFDVIISATNANGTGSATLTLTVQVPPPSGISIISGTSATGVTGSPFTFKVLTTGASANATVMATGLPPGLTIDQVTGVISGTPTEDGSSAVALTVTDGTQMANGTIELVFTSNPATPVILSSQVVTFVPGREFIYTIQIPASIDRDSVTFDLIGKENLPPGLTFNAAEGTITGTPTGTFAFRPGPQLNEGPPGGSEITATGSDGSTATAPFNPISGVAGADNISTRAKVETGDSVLIGGFIVTGAPQKVLLRAIGPELIKFNVPDALLDTTLDLKDVAGVTLASNDDWRATQESEIEDTGIPPTDPRESAIVRTLNPGLYTAVVRGKNDTVGVALVEVYGLGTSAVDAATQSQLANISTRGKVQTAANRMIGGFIIPQGTKPDVVVRALGPSLTGLGVPGALANPFLGIYDANGKQIATNDNWQENSAADQALLTSEGLVPEEPLESALVERTLAPGVYTAIVEGVDGSTGAALVEAYVLK